MPRLFSFASLLLCLLLEGCTVKLNDNKFFADAGPDGAYWFQSLSKGQGHLTKAEWDQQRFGMICESTDVFRNLKDVIDALCQNSGRCTYEQIQQEQTFFNHIGAGK